MRIQPADSISKESCIAEHEGHGVLRRVSSMVRRRKGQLAAGAVAGLALTTAAAIFIQQNRRWKTLLRVSSGDP